MSYIVLAIPLFFLLIGLEVLAAHLERRDVYRLNDAVADLSCGILDQLFEVFAKTVLFAGYLYLFESHRIWELPKEAAWTWAFGFVAVDFLYYWFHRSSHEINALWAAHVVHHQSEEYNLAVALRQGSFQSAFSWVFYLPLALLGFPPLAFLSISSFNTLYQFWIHTRLIGKLGPLEWVLNTPSHHRVHHGRNPKYIDRNHGGSLIVWDRLFGTFAEEQDEPVYGITRPLASFNPVWANFATWADLLGKARRARSFRDKLRVFTSQPGWQPDDLGGYEPPPELDPAYRKFDPDLPRALNLYVGLQFVLLLVGSGLYFNAQDALAPERLTAGAVLIGVSVVSAGALLERKSWAGPLEVARLLAGGLLAVAWTFQARPAVAALCLGYVSVSGAWLSLASRSAARSSLTQSAPSA